MIDKTLIGSHVGRLGTIVTSEVSDDYHGFGQKMSHLTEKRHVFRCLPGLFSGIIAKEVS